MSVGGTNIADLNSLLLQRKHVFKATVLGCLLLCCLALFATSPFVPSASASVFSDFLSLLSVGDTFDVSYDDAGAGTSGTITYKVTKEAEDGTPGEAMLTDGKKYVATADSPTLVLDKVTNPDTGDSYYVTCVDGGAFKDNENIYSVRFAHDMDGTSVKTITDTVNTPAAIGPGAFYNCKNLKSVTFDCQLLEGIGAKAFSKCSSLEEVTFDDDLQMVTKGIYREAFRACSSLKTFKVPAILSARRYGDYFGKYNSSKSLKFESGYREYWHSSNYCVENPGMGEEIFDECASLESITFAAGNPVGMFAYWKTEASGLRYLINLKTVIYEAAQPYFGNPNGSVGNRALVSVWGDGIEDGVTIKGADPTFYYAVDYYYTAEQADMDSTGDYAGDSRIARVEYAYGTSVSDIQAGNADALASSMAERSLYASKDADGVVPDPNEAALAAQAFGIEGFEDASEHQWVWYLLNSQSRRSGLADSCTAYLMKADSLEAARLVSDADDLNQFEALYRLCIQNFSQGDVQNSRFSAKYFYNGSYVQFDQGLTAAERQQVVADIAAGRTSNTALANMEGMYPWFTMDAGGLMTLPEQMQFYDGAGNQLDLTDENKFEISYQRYVDGELEAVDVTTNNLDSGPLLMTITPKAGSGYDTSTCLKEWILVNSCTGLVQERYETNASNTWWSAICVDSGKGYYNEARIGNRYANTEGNFAVCVSSQDPTSALVGTALASLCDGAINVTSSEAEFGFGLALGAQSNAAFNTHGQVTNTSGLTMFAASGLTPSKYAVAVYKNFEQRKSMWGLQDLNFGTTAVLVNPSYIETCSAAAASYSYNNDAFIFYTEDDGSVSDDTLEYLKKFTKVVVVGDTEMVTETQLDGLKESLGTDITVDRVAGQAAATFSEDMTQGNASALSLAMADYIINEEGTAASRKYVSIVVASGSDLVIDAVGCQNYTGHDHGITLVISTSADTKSVAQYLRNHFGEIAKIGLFGRSEAAANSSSVTLWDLLDATWDSNAEAVPAVDSTDPVEIYGVRFSADDERNLSNPVRQWGITAVKAGVYIERGTDGSSTSYTLDTDVEAVELVDKPVATTGLTYTGHEQIGVAASTAYNVSGGTAVDAGTYTATATLRPGYTWRDRSNSPVEISWSIAAAQQQSVTVKLKASSQNYTGSAITPVIMSVTLANGTKIGPSSYDVSYVNSSGAVVGSITEAGEYTVVVTLKGNYAGSGSVAFTVKAVQSSGSTSKSSSGSSSKKSSSASTASGSGSASSTNSTQKSSSTANSLGNKADKDGWITFEAPGNPADYDFNATSTASLNLSQNDMGAIDYLLLILSLVALGGAIFFATRSPKETEDQIGGELDG